MGSLSTVTRSKSVPQDHPPTAVAVRGSGVAEHEGVGTGGVLADGEIVVAFLGIAPDEEALLSQGLESHPAEAADLTHGLEVLAILDSDPAGGLPDGSEGAHEMAGLNPAHPAILGAVEGDGHPAVVLIHGIGLVVIGDDIEVLNTHMVDAAGPGEGADIAAAVLGVERHGHGDIHGDAAGVGGDHLALEDCVEVIARPEPMLIVGAHADIVRTEQVHPLLGLGTGHGDLVAHLEGMTGGERDDGGIDGHVGSGHIHLLPVLLVIDTEDLYDGLAAVAGGEERGAALPHPGAAQDHSGSANGEESVQPVLPLFEQHDAAEAVCQYGESTHVIDGLLDGGGVVTAAGAYPDDGHAALGEQVGDLLVGSHVAAEGEVGNHVPVVIGVELKFALLYGDRAERRSRHDPGLHGTGLVPGR